MTIEEIQRAILILQLYLSFMKTGTTDLNDEDEELVSVLGEHSVVKSALDKLSNKNYLLPL